MRGRADSARGIRCLVVACNTASASALDALRAQYPALPVIGVIEPGAAAAVAASESQHIAVIATEGTIGGGAYQTAIQRLEPRRARHLAGLFVVRFAGGGGLDRGPDCGGGRAPLSGSDFSRRATRPIRLVLGCTHFPALAAACARCCRRTSHSSTRRRRPQPPSAAPDGRRRSARHGRRRGLARHRRRRALRAGGKHFSRRDLARRGGRDHRSLARRPAVLVSCPLDTHVGAGIFRAELYICSDIRLADLDGAGCKRRAYIVDVGHDGIE